MQSLNLPYNPKIDQLRCLAAALVFFFHFHQIYYHPSRETLLGYSLFGIVTEGHTGVGLFFTLSGFLFMQIAQHHRKIIYTEFIRNRLLRILPLFATVFFVAISIGQDEFRPQDIFYLFFSNLGASPFSKSIITGAAWTISIEFTFYLLFPFIGRFAIERGSRYLLQLLGLMLLFKLGAYSVVERSTHMLYSTLIGRFDQFLIGMLAAVLYQQYHKRIFRYRSVMLPLACLAVLLNSAIQARYAGLFSPTPKNAFWVTWSLQESIGWAFFIVAWISAGTIKPRWLNKILANGGRISFSFYMFHTLVLYLVYYWLGFPRITENDWLDGAMLLIPLFLATWAVAHLSYVTIEEPFLHLRHRYGN